jgi:hypothetical protein
MRRGHWTLLWVPPVVVMGCADLIGISDLPGLPGSGDASPDHQDGSSSHHDGAHDGPRSDGPKGDAGDGGGGHDAADASAVTLTLAPTGVHLVQGTSANVTVQLTRAGSAAAVAVTLTGLPSGVTAGALTIPAAATMGTLTLTATSTATLGPAMVSIQGGGGSAPLDLVVAGTTGTIDTTFGTGGGVVTVVPSAGATSAVATSVVILEDGSIVVGGSLGATADTGWAVAHVLSDGTVDAKYMLPTLPTGGEVTSVARGPTSGPLAGTVLVAGSSPQCNVLVSKNQATVYVLQASGAAYDAFNSAGYWCTQYSSGTAAAGAGATSTGDVYVGINQPSAAPFVAHLSSTGTPGGWMFQGLPASLSLVGLAVDPADDAIVTGAYTGDAGASQFFALRYVPKDKGKPDPTFLGGVGPFGSPSGYLYAQCSALDPDSGVYVGGAGTITGETAVLGHVTAAGASDLGGDAGYVTNAFYVEYGLGYQSIAVQGDGRVVGVGSGSDMAGTLPFVARATTGGALDTTFNADAGTGYYIKQSGTNVTYNAVAVAPPPDGRIVIVGGEPGSGMYMLRMWP